MAKSKIFYSICFVATLVLAFIVLGPEKVLEYVNQFQTLAQDLKVLLKDLGYTGPLLIFVIYLVTTVFMLPLWGFHITCGYVYGTFWASLLISVTQAFCAGAAFASSRYAVAPYIRGFLKKRYGKKFTAIDEAVGKDGFKITVLLRLSPIIPFGVNNYVCGCTGMRLDHFVIGTWLGVLPGTTAYCNFGSLGDSLMEGETTTLQKCVMCLGIVAALGVIQVLNKTATRALKNAGIGDD